jgi:hypothetical protein
LFDLLKFVLIKQGLFLIISKQKCLNLLFTAPAVIAVFPHPMVSSHKQYCLVIHFFHHILQKNRNPFNSCLHQLAIYSTSRMPNVVKRQEMRNHKIITLSHSLNHKLVNRFITAVIIVNIVSIGANFRSSYRKKLHPSIISKNYRGFVMRIELTD